jgi:hypothetical protein
MKLHSAPGARSSAGDIALREAGIPFDSERGTLKPKATAFGAQFHTVAPKGCVHAVMLQTGDVACSIRGTPCKVVTCLAIELPSPTSTRS